MAEIVNNTNALISERSEFLGCVNPYLGIQSLLVENATKNGISYRSKEFNYFYEYSNHRDQWHIVIFPTNENSNEQDSYSMKRFDYEMYIIGHANDFITNRYNLQIQTMNGSCNPEIFNDEPYITHFVRLIVYRYRVKDRYLYQLENPELDKRVLGGNEQTFWNLVNEIMADQPRSDWTKMVRAIVS